MLVQRVIATGDGKSDDSVAFQNCASMWSLLAANGSGSTLYIPSGKYLLTQSIKISVPSSGNVAPLFMISDGWTSNILWAFDSHCFDFTDSMVQLTI